MKKMVLLAISTILVFVSCASSPEKAAEVQQAEVNQAFEEVYGHFEKLLILDGAKDYKVKYGDTLSKIAKDFYGDDNGYYFPLIMLASSDRVLDPDLIEPGMVLTVPDLQKNLTDASVHESLKTFFTEIADVYKGKDTATAGTVREELLKIARAL